MTIEFLANLAEIVAAIMIIGGALFGIVQLRELKQYRLTAVTSDLMRTFYSTYQIVQQLAGGMILSMWRKLHNWTDELRREQGPPSWAEWFQWLAERPEETKQNAAPAYEVHHAWQPTSR